MNSKSYKVTVTFVHMLFQSPRCPVIHHHWSQKKSLYLTCSLNILESDAQSVFKINCTTSSTVQFSGLLSRCNRSISVVFFFFLCFYWKIKRRRKIMIWLRSILTFIIWTRSLLLALAPFLLEALSTKYSRIVYTTLRPSIWTSKVSNESLLHLRKCINGFEHFKCF